MAVILIVISSISWAQEKSLTLIYSGNLDGELEPCGCSAEGDLGGILRHATILKQLRDETPNLVAISTGGMLASVAAQDKLTGEYILKGFSQLNYDGVAVQWSDLAYGDGFIRDAKLPWVASNLLSEGFAKTKEIERNGHHLALFSWLDPAEDPRAAMHGKHQTVDADLETLRQSLQQARQRGAVTLLSTTMTLDQAKATLPLELVDLLFIRAAYEVFGEPQKVGDTLVLQPGSRGMRIGRIDLTFNNDGRIQQWRNEVISMPATIANDQSLMPWYDEYNAKVKASYLERVALRKAREKGQSPFVSEEVCKNCHTAEHDKWRTTLHSKAFSKLEKVGKSFDPACIKCHTVGFEKEGGFIDVDATPQLMNVQCENCHGAGRAHSESKGIKPTANKGWQPPQVCGQCHIQTHSPSFKFENYWPKIRHGAVK
jgi:2',3'-cyclic-nucleotide 2'-phosphodiesterase (5'-nucleotidase family)